MADEYLFYDEDYEDISDWDEESDSNDKIKDQASKPVAKQNKISEQKVDPECEEEKKEPSPPTKNGTTAPTTPPKALLSTSNNANDVMVSRSPTAICIPYIPKSTASSFILHKYSVFTTKVFLYGMH